MKLRLPMLSLLLATVHLVALLVLIVAVYGNAMAELDGEAPGLARSAVIQVLDLACLVLAFPGAALWTPWMSAHLPDAAEWALFVGNSLLWGWVAALVVRRIARRGAAAREDRAVRPR